ncbi:class I SAM-dependent methyltransferase [Aporhodopirellula aestuarii]|uniref:Class I SAM-dependent methyltransferase n=1 Tax=Aporhodopirellula aestuarii TaxID=2950107 RepID=A0ABT0TYN3_9BACT|nr:methyltransferase [Aporhodopirellula aestuarii]MCM2369368.1 class I SAM-dependent methyltransferase [Aporhodopirellula aestuarii]
MSIPQSLPPLPSEQLLIEAIDNCAFANCLVVSPGRGQSGWHAKSLCPSGKVSLWYVDSFRAAQSRVTAVSADVDVEVLCSADLPQDPIQLALIPVLQRGEAEMTRDVLQQAHERLEIGGVMMSSVNNPKDRWLREQMQALFDKVNCKQTPSGWVYTATKRRALKKHRNFDAEFTFREQDRLITVFSRPSVFSHRSLDLAARRLISNSEVRPGDRVLDFGCGSGAVGLASAIRSESGDVFAVDCNARAIECVRRGAERNEISNLTATLNHDGQLPQIMGCDLALLNPPYYGDFAIAEHFLRTATKLIVDGGRALVVTKMRDEYHSRPWPNLWLESETEASGYQLLTYRKHDF